jgi:hypothetical protein
MHKVLVTVLFSSLIATPALACGQGDAPKPARPSAATTVPNVTPEAALSAAYVKVKTLRKRIDHLKASGQDQEAQELEMATVMALYGEPVNTNTADADLARLIGLRVRLEAAERDLELLSEGKKILGVNIAPVVCRGVHNPAPSS